MSITLFRGKYVKPLIELLDKNGNHILLIQRYNGSRVLLYRNNIPVIPKEGYKQIVITEKDYKRLLTLLNIMENPLEAFESIYYKE